MVRDENPSELAQVENEIRDDLDALTTGTDFTLLIKSLKGNSFSHSTGTSDETTLYMSASTSKLVTATIILSYVEKGILSLDDYPQDYISFWPTTGNLSAIQLKHLLNFTSGLVNEPLCVHFGSSNFTSCVGQIASLNAEAALPGDGFYYSSTHMQVAGLMAINAAGLTSWQEVFAGFQLDTGLFPSGSYDLPSLQNPRLAGGMH